MRLKNLNRPLTEQLEAAGRWLEPNAMVPELEPSLFTQRSERLQAAQETAGFDALLIYADREHSANLGWLTGFTPRFEEALWVQVAGQTPALLVGNENLEFARSLLPFTANLALYQPFSLPDQDRSQSPDLTELLRAAGLGRGLRVGCIGWKPGTNLELPHFIIEALEQITGARPENANGLLMHPETGLRTRLEPQMIALCEYAARLTSQAVLRAVTNLRPGISERETAGHLNAHGLELSCHPMVNFGASIPSGLRSPRNNRAAPGEYAQIAFGVIGSLTCRAGRLVTSRDPDSDDYLTLLENYLAVVRDWYAALRVGASGGSVFRAAEARRDPSWHLALNPGHLLHLDEWLGSPFTADSTLILNSGVAIQQDLIPVPARSPAAINLEDGLILADADLRARLERDHPALMRRCEARRTQMTELGYALHEDVLPLSDIAGICMPFLLEPDVVALVG